MCHDYVSQHTSLAALDKLLLLKRIQCLPQMFQVNLLQAMNIECTGDIAIQAHARTILSFTLIANCRRHTVLHIQCHVNPIPE